jgi:hypothetical protein
VATHVDSALLALLSFAPFHQAAVVAAAAVVVVVAAAAVVW